MTDSEMLELAAKAAGMEVWFPRMNGGKNADGTRIILTPCHTTVNGQTVEWNPLVDDGQALRLAVSLVIDLGFGTDGFGDFVCAITESEPTYSDNNVDKFAATRRAIVRAAADIGKKYKCK